MAARIPAVGETAGERLLRGNGLVGDGEPVVLEAGEERRGVVAAARARLEAVPRMRRDVDADTGVSAGVDEVDDEGVVCAALRGVAVADATGVRTLGVVEGAFGADCWVDWVLRTADAAGEPTRGRALANELAVGLTGDPAPTLRNPAVLARLACDAPVPCGRSGEGAAAERPELAVDRPVCDGLSGAGTRVGDEWFQVVLAALAGALAVESDVRSVCCVLENGTGASAAVGVGGTPTMTGVEIGSLAGLLFSFCSFCSVITATPPGLTTALSSDDDGGAVAVDAPLTSLSTLSTSFVCCCCCCTLGCSGASGVGAPGTAAPADEIPELPLDLPTVPAPVPLLTPPPARAATASPTVPSAMGTVGTLPATAMPGSGTTS